MSTKQKVEPKTRLVLVIPQKQKTGVINAIQAIRDLFGRRGEHWIQHEYKAEDEYKGDPFDSFCLVGAAREANGPYEEMARAALTMAVAEVEGDDDDLDGLISNIGTDAEDYIITDYNDRTKRTFKDICAIIKRAKQVVRDAPTR